MGHCYSTLWLLEEMQTSGKSRGRRQHGCPKARGKKHLHSSPRKLKNKCGITVFECLVTNIPRTFGRIGMLYNTSCFTRFTYCSTWVWALMQLCAEVWRALTSLTSDFKIIQVHIPAPLFTLAASLTALSSFPVILQVGTWGVHQLEMSLTNINSPSNIRAFEWTFKC